MGAKIRRDREFCRQLINTKMVKCSYGCGEIAKHFLYFNKDRVAIFCCKPRSKQCPNNKSKKIKPSWNKKYMECKIEIKNETQEEIIYRLNQIIKREKELDELQKYSDPIPIDFLNKFKKNYKN